MIQGQPGDHQGNHKPHADDGQGDGELRWWERNWRRRIFHPP